MAGGNSHCTCWFCRRNPVKVVKMITQITLWIGAIIVLIGIVVCIIKKRYNYAIALGFLEILIILYNNLYLLP